jgi:hypothetical protein
MTTWLVGESGHSCLISCLEGSVEEMTFAEIFSNGAVSKPIVKAIVAAIRHRHGSFIDHWGFVFFIFSVAFIPPSPTLSPKAAYFSVHFFNLN